MNLLKMLTILLKRNAFLVVSIVFLYYSPNELYCQYKEVKPQPVFNNFTTDDGLPSNEVYHAFQDSLGYIWFATNNGVSRFNGYNFENFGLEDGLVDNTIFEIYADYRGRLWFISHVGNLVYYENGIFNAYPYNNKIQKLLPATRGPIKKSFYVDKSDNVHISFKKFGRLKITPEGIIQGLNDQYEKPDLHIERLIDGTLLLTNPIKNLTKKVVYSDGINQFEWSNKELFNGNYLSIHTNADYYNNSIFLTCRGNLVQLWDNKILSRVKLGEELIWLSIDSSYNLWVSPAEGGVYCFSNCNINEEPFIYTLKSSQILSVLQDYENGYWFTTLNDGVFYCPNIYAQSYLMDEMLLGNKISALYANDAIYLGFDNGSVGIIRNNDIEFLNPTKQFLSYSAIRDITETHDKQGVLVSSSVLIHYISPNSIENYLYSINNFKGILPRQIIKSIKGDYIVAGVQGLKRFDGNKVTYDSHVFEQFSAIIYSVFEKNDGTVLLGCANGLWEFKDNAFYYLGDQSPLLSKQILSIKGFIDGTIFLGTKGIGLITLFPNGDLKQFTIKDGISSNTVNHIYVDSNYVWLSTSEGANRISIDGRTIGSIVSINKSKGLPINDVLEIYRKDNDILIATRNGLTIINSKDIAIDQTVIKCYIKKILVNNIEKNIINNNLILNHYENFINIEYLGFSYLSNGKIPYRYRLVGADSAWIYTTNTNAIYSNIASRNYTFEVQAQNNDGIWSPSQKLEIYIRKPYWQTTLFIILITLAFSALLFTIYRIRIQSIRKRNELLNTTNLYKQQALRQQMNPHFIFNTLNSIQLFILENDPLNSHKYLTKFARLIRMTLDNSQEPKVSVKDEIEALKLYLELESLRLEGKFTFNINIAQPDLLGYKIPTLLIQPFVENAIWHGIMMKETKSGHVDVTVEKQNGYLICQIEDDGIGRKAAIALNKRADKQHKSLGYKITAQRIELLNTIYRDSFSIEYDDLINTNGEPTGTKVTIRIPI